jgi:hypothetical protein
MGPGQHRPEASKVHSPGHENRTTGIGADNPIEIYFAVQEDLADSERR